LQHCVAFFCTIKARVSYACFDLMFNLIMQSSFTLQLMILKGSYSIGAAIILKYLMQMRQIE
jgi:hypothetical protein